MPIYDLNDINFLKHDIENNLKTIDTIYVLKFKKGGNEHHPRIVVSNESHWTSPAFQNVFNDLIPIVKSLLKDMYAVLENLFKARTGTFDKTGLESKYLYLKELRQINNKFKHYLDSGPEINVTSMALMEPDGNHVDVFCNFSYKDGNFVIIRLAEFIDVYLGILEDQKIISIHRET
jgi:hypothetical protein